MANNYDKILELANANNMGLSNTIKRDFGIPLDYTSVQASYEAALTYAATNTLAYVGQPISVGDKLYIVTAESQGKYPAEVEEGQSQIDIFLAEVGSATEGDDKTIALKDGVLSLYGIDGKTSGTYVPTLVDGVLTWNAPDNTTVDGLTASVDALNLKVFGKEAEGEQEAVDGLVDIVAAQGEAIAGNTQAIADEKSARETAVSGEATAREQAIKAVTDSIGTVAEGKTVVEMIEEAEAAAKAAIPTNNASLTNGAGYQTADDVSSAITTAIAGKADASSVYTRTEVDGKIEGLENTIAGITHFTTKVVSSTDEVTEIGILYLIKDESVSGADKYNEYLFIEGIGATLIGDTTTDLADYVTNDALATELAKYTTTEGLATVLAPYAKTDDVNTELDKKVNVSDYNTDKATFALEESVASRLDGKAAVGDSYLKSEADTLLAAKADKETVNAELAKKVETAQIRHTSEGVGEGVTKEGTALTITVDAYRKSEVYTKSETDNQIDAKIASVTGGESAADVKLALESYRDALNTEVWGADAAKWTSRTTDEDGKVTVTYTPQYGATSRVDTLEADVATLKTNVEKAQTDATAAGTAVSTLESGKVATNAANIATIQGQITGEGGLSARIGAIEAANTTHATEYANLKAKVDTVVDTTIPALTNRVAANEADLVTIKNTLDGVEGSEGLVATVAKKIDADKVYTKIDIDGKVGTIEAAIALKANSADVYTKGEVDNLLENLDQSAILEAIAGNAATIQTLVDKDANKSVRTIATEVLAGALEGASENFDTLIEMAKWLEDHSTDAIEMDNRIKANENKLAGIGGENEPATVMAAIDAKIEAIPAYELPVASTSVLGGIMLAAADTDNAVVLDSNNVATVARVNVNSLVQTAGDTLIMNGGSAI